ncbi:hypothetical protein [Streptomyces sp. NPDC053560]|uniref:hypothetical protein n=1 Tax=Streptomyces sp. NPDC053560 TaxID=3365711 RepID=UPI0037D3246E
MTTDLPEAAAGPRTLSPRDEARVRLADATWHLSSQARRSIPVDPDTPAGDLLCQALDLRRLAEAAVESAVIAERERGTTWEQLAQAAGTTRQSAHERWAGVVQSWARRGRISSSAPEVRTLDTVAFLDAQYATPTGDPARTDAVSAGLDATRHPGSAAYEEAQRARGQQLHARREELTRDLRRCHEEYDRLKEPTDRTGWLRLAANCTATADLQAALAGVHEELMAAEPTLAEEHRAGAEERHQFAKQNREHAELALERAGAL